jgi:hypothetical protein
MRNNKKHFQTLGNATINRYFEVGTIIRINRLKPVNCSTKFIIVALIKFATAVAGISLPIKVHLKKNPEAENSTVIYRESNSYRLPSNFFWSRFFSGCTFTGKLQVPTSTIQFLWWGLPIQAFLGWGSYFIWIWGVINIYMFTIKKNILWNTPCCQIWDRIWNPKQISV